MQYSEKPGNVALLYLVAVFLRISGNNLETLWSTHVWMSPFAEIRPLQDLTNAKTPSISEVSRRPSRRRQDPGCYTEPKLNRLGFKLFLSVTVPTLQPLICCHVLTLQGWTLCCSVFKFLLPFVFLWPSSSTTVWLSQNSALAQMHVQASVNKLPTMLFPSLNQVHLLADCTCYTPVLMKD